MTGCLRVEGVGFKGTLSSRFAVLGFSETLHLQTRVLNCKVEGFGFTAAPGVCLGYCNHRQHIRYLKTVAFVSDALSQEAVSEERGGVSHTRSTDGKRCQASPSRC